MIVNRTKKKTLAESLELADSLWKQTKGLMFRPALQKGSGLLMDFGKEKKAGIWMFGMRFPLDIIYIDKKGRAVDIKEQARPLTLNPRTWKVYHPKTPARYVLEVPAGTVKETGTAVSDTLSIQGL